jgi:hypothetical protein
MARVMTLRAPVSALDQAPARTRTSPLAAAWRSVATAVGILAASLVILLLPGFLHPLLDAAGAHAQLGVPPAEVHRLSDRTVRELLVGPGTFAFAGPGGGAFFDASEAGHLRDVRVVLLAFLAVGVLGTVGVALSLARSPRGAAWRAVARGAGVLGVCIVVGGVVALVAFEPAFELFHRIFFPGGNYAFDPRTQRLVQLYPLAFWQLVTGVLGAVALALSAVVWSVARRGAERDGR